jgi:peptidoglycan L-alanyl-D-glutamate endopeptidase CwlK
MGYKFGKTSNERLKDVHIELVKVLQEAVKVSDIDFAITEGHRSITRQKQLFDEGKSKIDGVTRKGKHNYFPSLAVDIAVYHPDLETRKKLLYDKASLSFIAGIIQSTAVKLYEAGIISHLVRWGGNWDKDGVIIQDQSFIDLPHFELYKP